MEARIAREFEATYSKIDHRGHAKPSFFFEIMQDIATTHAAMMALDPTSFNIVWVLSRIQLNLLRPVAPYETVRCETWCAGIRGVSWYRNYQFFVGEETIGEAASMWVILSPETHKILRPAQFEVAQSYIDTSEEAPQPLPKLTPADDATLHHTHTVRYSDLDVNQHLNNVKISDIVCDALDLTQERGALCRLQINFAKETLHGETLSLFTCAPDSNTCMVQGQAADTERFTALATFEPTPT